jgi:hypothetical protein
VEHEDAGELTPMLTRQADAVTAQDGGAKPRPPHPRMREIAQAGLRQTEESVQVARRIAHAGEIGHTVMGEPPIRFVGRGHVHERHLRSTGFDSCAMSRHAGQRLPAERSTEVPEKDEQHRPALLHLL